MGNRIKYKENHEKEHNNDQSECILFKDKKREFMEETCLLLLFKVAVFDMGEPLKMFKKVRFNY